jgi:hypothetical protein
MFPPHRVVKASVLQEWWYSGCLRCAVAVFAAAARLGRRRLQPAPATLRRAWPLQRSVRYLAPIFLMISLNTFVSRFRSVHPPVRCSRVRPIRSPTPQVLKISWWRQLCLCGCRSLRCLPRLRCRSPRADTSGVAGFKAVTTALTRSMRAEHRL